MLGRFSRTELLLGEEALRKLAGSCVAVFGVGGVGSFVAEGLARSGVGHLVLIDNDTICETNINRQLHALTSTVGRRKTEVMRERILDINPEAVVDVIDAFYLPETADAFFAFPYDYIVDAIDTVAGKIDLVLQAQRRAFCASAPGALPLAAGWMNKPPPATAYKPPAARPTRSGR